MSKYDDDGESPQVLFARHFSEYVVPKLLRLCALWSGTVAAGTVPYSHAVDSVMGEAVRLGASHLTPEFFDHLEDFVLGFMADLALLAEVEP